MIKVTPYDIKSTRKKANEFYTKFISQKVSHYFSAFFVNKKISPNIVTSFMAIFGLPSIFLLLSDNLIIVLIGAVGLILINVFDTCDGEVARFTKKTSLYGEYLDNIYQIIVDLLLLYVLVYKFYFLLNSTILAGIVFLYSLIFGLDIFSKKVIKSLSKEASKSGGINKKSTPQFIIHITSSNTFIYHSLWAIFLIDYYFTNQTHYFLIAYFSYLLFCQILKILVRQYIYFKKLNN